MGHNYKFELVLVERIASFEAFYRDIQKILERKDRDCMNNEEKLYVTGRTVIKRMIEYFQCCVYTCLLYQVPLPCC